MACAWVKVGKTRGAGGGGAGIGGGNTRGADGATVTGTWGGCAKAEAAKLAAIPIRAVRGLRKDMDLILLQQTRTRLYPRLPYFPPPI